MFLLVCVMLALPPPLVSQHSLLMLMTLALSLRGSLASRMDAHDARSGCCFWVTALRLTAKVSLLMRMMLGVAAPLGSEIAG